MNTDKPNSTLESLQTEQWAQEIAQWQAESIGWTPLGQGAYLHMPNCTPANDVNAVLIVGNATVPPEGWAALLLG